MQTQLTCIAIFACWGLNGIWKTSFCVDQDYHWFGTHPFLLHVRRCPFACRLNGLQRIKTCVCYTEMPSASLELLSMLS